MHVSEINEWMYVCICVCMYACMVNSITIDAVDTVGTMYVQVRNKRMFNFSTFLPFTIPCRFSHIDLMVSNGASQMRLTLPFAVSIPLLSDFIWLATRDLRRARVNLNNLRADKKIKQRIPAWFSSSWVIIACNLNWKGSSIFQSCILVTR